MRRDLRRLPTIRPRTTASLPHKTRGTTSWGARSSSHPKSRTGSALSWSSGLARSGQWDVYAIRKSAPCALEHRSDFFLQRRFARHTLVLKTGRTGPTAGETGPRCGRTCGATRRQRSDDSPLISNHALKKGGRRQNALALVAGRGLAWARDGGEAVFKSPSSDGPPRSGRPGVVRWWRRGPLCRSFSECAASFT